MRKKGVVVPLLVVLSLTFILTGFLLSTSVSGKVMREEVQYNSGSLSAISEARARSSFHTAMIRRELNYSSNIAAKRLGEDGGGVTWDKTIPTIVQLRNIWEAETLEELETQNRISECEEPSIGSVNSRKDSLSIRYSDPHLVCESRSTQVRLLLAEENPESKNAKNRYPEISRFAIKLSKEAKELISSIASENPIRATETYSGACGDKKSSVRAEAEERAKNEATASFSSVASDAYSNVREEKPKGVFMTQKSTSFSGSHQTSQLSESDCTFTHIGHCIERDEDDECIEFHEHEDTEYEYESTYTISEVIAEYEMRDGKFALPAPVGGDMLTNIVFDFSYKHALSD